MSKAITAVASILRASDLDWWDTMSPEGQARYLRMHPGSKMAKQRGESSTQAQNDEHDQLARRHHARNKQLAENKAKRGWWGRKKEKAYQKNKERFKSEDEYAATSKLVKQHKGGWQMRHALNNADKLHPDDRDPAQDQHEKNMQDIDRKYWKIHQNGLKEDQIDTRHIK